MNDIKDDELRVIGSYPAKRGKGKWIVLSLVAVVLVVLAVSLYFYPKEEEAVDLSFEPIVDTCVIEPLEPLGNYSDSTAYTELLKRTINDVPLDIYIPHNAHPILSLKLPDVKDPNIIFASQAADIRADNKKINGAFVLAGKPLAWGLSKKGYVAILGDSIYVGMAENSPLFEEATEKEGYFFRQYALVDNGRLVESELKNKCVRKAVCQRLDETFVVMTETRESMHDFAQALVDLGVQNAVYIVGSDSFGFYRDIDSNLVEISPITSRRLYRNDNYIIWTTSEVGSSARL